MTMARPRRMMARMRTGSSTASMSSRMFSIMMGSPLWIAISTEERYLFCVSCTHFISLSVSFSGLGSKWPFSSSFQSSGCDSLIVTVCFRLIHLIPCSCGSMSSGQRLQLAMMAPFCTDTLSVGSPSSFHTATCASSHRMLSGLMPSVIGILRSVMSMIHWSNTSECLYLALKAPMYDTNADATNTSPTYCASCASKLFTDSVQRTFSSASPLTRRVARSALRCVFSAAATASFFSCVALSNCVLSSESFASSPATCARTDASCVLALSSLVLASASSCRFGSTTS
mmetsp:Transcript_66859/g.164843  ORF Transcript_66859/g.164843 Transcript_66859/m.164843 type:complete len:286 (-) Transcript_66859:3010-3867(-)